MDTADEKRAKFRVIDRRGVEEEPVSAAAPAPKDQAPKQEGCCGECHHHHDDDVTEPMTGPAEAMASGATATGATTGAGPQATGPIQFTHFCLSLAGSAQIAMGLVPNPQTNLVMKDFAAARQTIDLLAMLQTKTKGNLTAEEAGILDELLYTLRMQYVELTKAT